MNLNYSKQKVLLLLMVFCFMLFSLPSISASDDSDYIVQNLEVKDIPNDDGTGLVLSWKPLPKEKRIIEYRVYRGVTPDTLFFIGRIDVNVKTGVSGDVMYFYDNNFNYFADIRAPGKLKKEKQQPADSPLYRRFPRDLSITGPQLENYDVLGIIPEKDFYFKNVKTKIVEDADTTVYAGLHLRNFSQLAKKLIPDHEYYYTVLAVTESRSYKPYAEPVMGIPRDNAPEKITDFYPVFVKDINRLQFEWSLPFIKSDINLHSVYMLAKKDVKKFEEYVAEQKEIELNDIAVKEDTTIAKKTATIKNPAVLVFRRKSANPYISMKTGYADIVDGKIVNEEFGIDADVDAANINDYYFVFSLRDYFGYETFSDLKEIRVIDSSELPQVPPFTVMDRKNDKGDYNSVMWGKPVVYLTNSNYLNEKKTKILINYDWVTNNNYKIRNIYFTVFDENGNKIARINEYYQDKKIKVKLPKGKNGFQTLTVEMSFKCDKPLEDDYIFVQKLFYNEQSKSLKPEKAITLKNDDITRFSYYIYKRNLTDARYRLSKKLAGTQRELDDNISFTYSHYKLVKKFDAKKQLLLVDPGFSIIRDYEKDTMVRTSLYPSEIQKTIDSYEKEIVNYQAKIDSATTDEEKKSYEEALEFYQNQVTILKENPILKEADSFTNNKKRLKFLQKARRKAKRSFEYKIVMSNGEGIFTETNVYKDENGNDHFEPVPNWFDKTEIPTLLATLIFGSMVFIMINKAKKGHDLYIRPIAGIEEIDNAIGRATEMGRPILFVPGLSGISDIATLAGLAILGRVAKKAAEYDTKILIPVRDYIVLPIAQEIVKEAHYEAGRPDTYDKRSVFFITTAQFAFVAGVNGVMIREKTATNFYMGMFYAESLIMTETGSITGAIQIAGTDAVTQIPFFITTCDYTLIGEELYAASAYLAREPLMLGTLKAQDYTKFLILLFIIAGSVLSTLHLTFLINAFPEK